MQTGNIWPNLAHVSQSPATNLAKVVTDALADARLLTADGKASREADRRTGISRSTLDRLLVSGEFKPTQLVGVASAAGVEAWELMRRAEGVTA